MLMRNYERGIEELALNLALDIEPHDPPKGMGDRLFAKIEAAGTGPTSSTTLPAAKESKFTSVWTKGVAAASVILLALYGTTLYENQQLKEQLTKKPNKTVRNVVSSLNPLGEVERTIPLSSSNGTAKGTAYVVNSSQGTHIEIFGKGIIKENDRDVIQVWIKENGKIRTVGATEPVGGSVNFSAVIEGKIDGIAITREKNYDNLLNGDMLLSYGFPTNGTAQPSEPTNIDVAQRSNNRHHPNHAQTAIAKEPALNEERHLIPPGDRGDKKRSDSGGGNSGGGTNKPPKGNDSSKHRGGNRDIKDAPNSPGNRTTPERSPNHLVTVGLLGNNDLIYIKIGRKQ